MLHARHLAAGLLVLAAACSTKTSGATDRVGKNPDLISTAELQDPAIAGGSAQYAIQQLRPAFFRTRGPQSLRNSDAGAVKISQDFGPLQPSTALSGIEARTLIEIRYLNAVDAQSRFGINANGGPVIVLLTSRQP